MDELVAPTAIFTHSDLDNVRFEHSVTKVQQILADVRIGLQSSCVGVC
jgi:hypothetical protein